AAVVAALALAVSPVSFVQAHASGGGFAEPGGTADPLLTAWAVLGLRAAGADAPGSLDYLRAQEGSLRSSTDVALVALAEQALGFRNDALVARLRVLPTGQIGETLNSTYWGVLALGRAWTARLERHRGRDRGVARRRREGQAGRARGLVPARVPAPRRRLRADARPRLGCAVDGVGDPGARRRRRAAAAQRVHLPRAAEAGGRQLPLLGAVRDDAGLGHVAGARRAGEEAVSALTHSRRRPTTR